jgi:hypothetical protein
MAYRLQWWKEGMEFPAFVGPNCIIRKEDAESMAAALNEKFPGVNHLVIDLDYMPSQERDLIGT